MYSRGSTDSSWEKLPGLRLKFGWGSLLVLFCLIHVAAVVAVLCYTTKCTLWPKPDWSSTSERSLSWSQDFFGEEYRSSYMHWPRVGLRIEALYVVSSTVYTVYIYVYLNLHLPVYTIHVYLLYYICLYTTVLFKDRCLTITRRRLDSLQSLHSPLGSRFHSSRLSPNHAFFGWA